MCQRVSPQLIHILHDHRISLYKNMITVLLRYKKLVERNFQLIYFRMTVYQKGTQI